MGVWYWLDEAAVLAAAGLPPGSPMVEALQDRAVAAEADEPVRPGGLSKAAREKLKLYQVRAAGSITWAAGAAMAQEYAHAQPPASHPHPCPEPEPQPRRAVELGMALGGGGVCQVS